MCCPLLKGGFERQHCGYSWHNDIKWRQSPHELPASTCDAHLHTSAHQHLAWKDQPHPVSAYPLVPCLPSSQIHPADPFKIAHGHSYAVVLRQIAACIEMPESGSMVYRARNDSSGLISLSPGDLKAPFSYCMLVSQHSLMNYQTVAVAILCLR